MIIRKIKKEDYFKVIELGKLLHKNFSYQENEFTNCLVFEKDNNIIGFIIFMLIYERAEIIDVLIDPLYRNRGYASKLLEYAINAIRLSGCNNITLEVNCNNKYAILLYIKNGFEIRAIRKKYYGNEDGYLMEKVLG